MSIIKNKIKTLLELWDMCRVPRRECNTSKLGKMADTDLKSLLFSVEIGKFWENVKTIIDTLELPKDTGGINPGDQRALYYLTRTLKPKSVLEIGTHIGCSTAHLALAMKENGGMEKLVTVDIKDVNDADLKPWKSFGSKHSPLEMIKKMGAQDLVHFEVSDSVFFLKNTKESFDLIFLDGAHDAKTLYQEIPLALTRLRKGGLILLHDFFTNGKPLWKDGRVIWGPYLATQRLMSEGGQFLVLPLGDLPWESKLGSHTTSLAIITSS